MPLPALTNSYKYQRYAVIHNVDPDDGDRGDLRNVDFYYNTNKADRPRKF
jgi:hypothetical protein